MPFLADSIWVNCSTSGLTDFTTTTALNGYRTFAGASVPNGSTIRYSARTTTEFENGEGTYNSGTGVVSRTTIFASSNANAKVNFGSSPTLALTPMAADFKNLQAKTIFYPQDNEPPTSAYATLDTRNSHPVLDFDDTTAEAAIFTGVLTNYYSNGGLTVEVAYSCTSATTGTVGFTVEIERIGDSQLDVDSDNFASAQTITAVTVPGTSGHVDVVSVNISNGANMDSLAAGEQYRIRIKRDVATDTAVGDAEVHWIAVREQ